VVHGAGISIKWRLFGDGQKAAMLGAVGRLPPGFQKPPLPLRADAFSVTVSRRRRYQLYRAEPLHFSSIIDVRATTRASHGCPFRICKPQRLLASVRSLRLQKAETSDQDNTNGQDNHRPDDDPAATRLAAAADPSDTVQSTAEDRIGERNQGWRGGRSCTEQGYTEQGYAERGDAEKVPQAATAFAGESLSASVMPRRIRFDRCRPSAEDS
jgi:hypothetical protein